MKLNLMERFIILQILPQNGNFVTLNIIRKLQEQLAPSEDDIKNCEIVMTDTQTKWNKKGLEEVEIHIGEKASDIIIDALKKLDEENKLTTQHLSIYEKFINSKKGV